MCVDGKGSNHQWRANQSMCKEEEWKPINVYPSEKEKLNMKTVLVFFYHALDDDDRKGFPEPYLSGYVALSISLMKLLCFVLCVDDAWTGTVNGTERDGNAGYRLYRKGIAVKDGLVG